MKRIKRVLAMMLAVVMIVAIQSVVVLADEGMNVVEKELGVGEETVKAEENVVVGNIEQELNLGNAETYIENIEQENKEENVNVESNMIETYAAGDVIASGNCGEGLMTDQTEWTYTCMDNLTYVLTSDGTLTISGSGEMNHGWSDIFGGWHTVFSQFKDQIKKVVIEDGMTIIGIDGFADCMDLTEVIIPNSVTGIGTRAFKGCSSLEKIEIPNSVTGWGDEVFAGCNNLREVKISENITEITEGTFEGCSNLCQIEIPDKVTMIASNAFEGCEQLTELNIPNEVDYIGNGAFKDCRSLTKVVIPNKVSRIDCDTFESCSNISTITIPSSISYIYGGAFANCFSLKNIYFEGSAPEFSSYRYIGESLEPFSSVTANVYYPGGNDTYTADNMLDYGGKLTWIAQESKVDELAIVLEVTDRVYYIGSGGNATIKCTGELKDFVSAALDRQLIDPSCYTTAEGSTVLTLLSSYLDTLSVGDHVVTLNYTYGSIDTVLTVLDRSTNDTNDNDSNSVNAGNAENENNGGSNAGNMNNGNNVNKESANGVPKTGDATLFLTLWLLCTSSGICVLALTVRRKSYLD